MSATKYEAWRLTLDRTARFEAKTGPAAIKTAHKACGIGGLPGFKAWLDELGVYPFSTGKAWVINVPHGPARKLTSRPIPSSGAETY